jgi:MFS family permease
MGNRRQSEAVMIEVYLFLAVFPVQILAMSVLYPVRFAGIIRAGLANIPAARLADLYPGVDVGHAHERFLARYRAANAVVAVLGLLLMGWLISYMQRPNWDEGAVGGIMTAYYVLQCFPIVLIAWFTTRFNKVHRRPSPKAKRKAILQRRGPFDFVSPYVVLLAVLSYCVFVAVTLYVAQNPFPGFAGAFVNIGIVTSMYLLGGFVVFLVLYGRKKDPLQTHAERRLVMSAALNAYAWVCILVPVFVSLSFAQKVLNLETWGPFVGAMCFLILSALSFRGLVAPPRQSEADRLGSSPVHQ